MWEQKNQMTITKAHHDNDNFGLHKHNERRSLYHSKLRMPSEHTMLWSEAYYQIPLRTWTLRADLHYGP